jgi:hypothetical protein
LSAGVTRGVSGAGHAGPNGSTYSPALSADGRYVAFVSTATNLTSGDTNERPDVYAYDLNRGSIELVSRTRNGKAGNLLELIMRRYERASTLLTSNRPVDDWGKLLGDTAAVTALLDRLLHHAHVLKCGPRSWRTKVQTDLRTEEGTQ